MKKKPPYELPEETTDLVTRKKQSFFYVCLRLRMAAEWTPPALIDSTLHPCSWRDVTSTGRSIPTSFSSCAAPKTIYSIAPTRG